MLEVIVTLVSIVFTVSLLLYTSLELLTYQVGAPVPNWVSELGNFLRIKVCDQAQFER